MIFWNLNIICQFINKVSLLIYYTKTIRPSQLSIEIRLSSDHLKQLGPIILPKNVIGVVFIYQKDIVLCFYILLLS
jgi:hypothetical protein